MSNPTDVSRANSDLPFRAILMGRIVKWIHKISTPEFREFKRRQLTYALASDFEHELGLVEAYGNFDFGDPIDKQHALIMSFLYLSQATETLSQAEHYFRRYPFSKSPVSREDHARNMCEFYFGQFYVIEERIKKVLNNLKEIELEPNINTGKIIKKFQKEFKQELRMRHGVTHHEPFDDIDLDRLFVTRVMSSSVDLKNKGWDKEHLHHYRKFASSWAKRAKRRSADAQIFVDVIALVVLEHATFLEE